MTSKCETIGLWVIGGWRGGGAVIPSITCTGRHWPQLYCEREIHNNADKHTWGRGIFQEYPEYNRPLYDPVGWHVSFNITLLGGWNSAMKVNFLCAMKTLTYTLQNNELLSCLGPSMANDHTRIRCPGVKIKKIVLGLR